MMNRVYQIQSIDMKLSKLYYFVFLKKIMPHKIYIIGENEVSLHKTKDTDQQVIADFNIVAYGVKDIYIIFKMILKYIHHILINQNLIIKKMNLKLN